MRKAPLLIFLSLLLLIAFKADGQSSYALLIGIGNYPESSGWNKIHGNGDVPKIKANLLRQGFPEENIIQLIDFEATKGNIIAAFDSLSGCLQVGDVVYVHFSGHGQQVTDLDGDEEDGYDEAWIPYDARKSFEAGVYEGENHIIDDELNVILRGLRECVGNEGKIIVVADACHSGGGSRGMSDEYCVRGTKDNFIIPKSAEVTQWQSGPTDWLFIAACKSYQSNYEYRTADGEYVGTLSYVIANDTRQFSECEYSDLLSEWEYRVSDMSRYPQDIDNEGRPNQDSQYMF